jgi:hypothetical protein
MLTGVFSIGVHSIFLELDGSFLQNHFSYLVQRGSFAVGITYGNDRIAFFDGLYHCKIPYHDVSGNWRQPLVYAQ